MSKPTLPKCRGEYELIPYDRHQRLRHWWTAQTKFAKVKCLRCGRKVKCKVRIYGNQYLWVRMPMHDQKSSHFQPKMKKKWDQKKTVDRK